MDIINTNEEIVFKIVQDIFESLQSAKNPENFCLCEQCRLDTICYTLNRINPQYVVSNRGITRMDFHSTQRQQLEADITYLAFNGLRLVNHNMRSTASHDEDFSFFTRSLEHKPIFDIPTIVGRIFDGRSFTPITDVSVELWSDTERVEMRNHNWQNPYKVFSSTPGAFSFWPMPVIAEGPGVNRVFKYSIKVHSEDYDVFTHFFDIPVISKVYSAFAYSAVDNTHKLPDMYIFPSGEADEE
ncbi:MAG: late competence development ComFB family protein [Spirochaetes bacterium]|nr:late competence development ComFB family protein [Spirochaetota bacterium]